MENEEKIIKKYYIGIDPGKSGAVAVLDQNLNVVFLEACPNELVDMCYIYAALNSYKPERVLIEKVHARPNNGVRQAFSFGENYGQLQAIFTCGGMELEYVQPTAWQKDMGLVIKREKGEPKESNTDKKNRHKDLAQKIFPNIKVTHKLADALLIAVYASNTVFPPAWIDND